MNAGPVRIWDLDAPDMDPSDYIIGSTLGWWKYDEDSLEAAIVTTLAKVLQQMGLSTEDAIDKALATVYPDEGEMTVGIRVERADDDRYEVKFDFDRDALVDGSDAGLVERSDPNREEQ